MEDGGRGNGGWWEGLAEVVGRAGRSGNGGWWEGQWRVVGGNEGWRGRQKWWEGQAEVAMEDGGRGNGGCKHHSTSQNKRVKSDQKWIQSSD